MIRWIGVVIVFQVAMVLVGHWVPAVALLFAPLGMGISLAVGFGWARAQAQAQDYRHAAWGGAVVGGVCALVGIAISLVLGDVPAAVLGFGTLSSAVTGALGGLVGGRIRFRAAAMLVCLGLLWPTGIVAQAVENTSVRAPDGTRVLQHSVVVPASLCATPYGGVPGDRRTAGLPCA